jgi:hypothetical protein
LSGISGLRDAAIAKPMVSGVGSVYGLCICDFQLSFRKRWLARTDRLLVAVNVRVRLPELNASTMAVHVAETADVHEDVKAKTVACAKSP